VFITIDGPGGSGKTSVVAALTQQLADVGISARATSEPTEDSIGELARSSTQRYHGTALALLVAADRFHHLTTDIGPALDAGVTVICDRYVPSSYVLQQRDGVPLDFLRATHRPAMVPDLAVLLTADPDVLYQRITVRGPHNRFEADLAASTAEVELFSSIEPVLADDRWPTVTLDVTRRDLMAVVATLRDRILHDFPHLRVH